MTFASRAAVLGFLVLFVAVTIVVLTQSQSIPQTYACIADEDCVPAQCCHPTSVVNKKFAPDCEGIVCTAVCEGPLDCGAGRPACVSSRCVIMPIGGPSVGR